MSSDLEKCIEAFPNENWDWSSLPVSHAISLSFIERHIDYPWDFDEITGCTFIDHLLPIVVRHPDKPWSWTYISVSTHCTTKYVELLQDKLDYAALSLHIPLSYIMDNSDKQWNWDSISERLEMEIPKYVAEYPNLPWSFNSLSKNPYLGTWLIEQNIDKPWNWTFLSLNVSLDWSFIKKHLDKPWDWKKLSMSTITTWDVIAKNPAYPWEWKYIFRFNPNITFDIVMENPHVKWDFSELSANRFGYQKKLDQYEELVQDISSLKIFHNGMLPASKYLEMEIFASLPDYDKFSPYEIFSML